MYFLETTSTQTLQRRRKTYSEPTVKKKYILENILDDIRFVCVPLVVCKTT